VLIVIGLRSVLNGQAQQEFWYQAFHQLPLAEILIDGQVDAVRRKLLVGRLASAQRLDRLGDPRAASIGLLCLIDSLSCANASARSAGAMTSRGADASTSEPSED
jgi:hypothetical protein